MSCIFDSSRVVSLSVARSAGAWLLAVVLKSALLMPAILSAPAAAHAVIIINDVRSPGVRGDDKLSLHEAILIATDRIQLFELSPAEALQVILDPGRFQVDTLIFDASVFPATIILETALPSLDDPIGDYVDGTNFNQLPIGSIRLDGSRLPPGTPIFEVEGSNTGIYGWHLYGAQGDAIHVRPSTLLPRMHGLLFQANVIEGSRGAGIAIETGSSQGISWDMQVLENLFISNAGGGLRFEAQAGLLQDARLQIERNLFETNGVPVPPSTRALHGIACIGATQGNDFLGEFDIRHNFIRASPGCGILIDGAGPGSTWSGVMDGNGTQGNGYGVALIGASLPGAGQNDVASSLRNHRAWRDLHASIFAIGGSVPGTSGAFVSLSLRNVHIDHGCDIAQIWAGAGAGDQHTLSCSMREVGLSAASGDALRFEATAADALQGQAVQARATHLEIRNPMRAGIAIYGGAGHGGSIRFTGAAMHIEGASEGLVMHGSDGSQVLRNHDVQCEFTDARWTGNRLRAGRLDGRDGRLALKLRHCMLDNALSDGLQVMEGTGGTTNWAIDLGSAISWGLNSFLDHASEAIATNTPLAAIAARGNWWGQARGANPPGTPNGVAPGIDVAASLSAPTKLRLDLSDVFTPIGGTLVFGLPDATSATFVFLGTQSLDYSAQGGSLWIDPFHPSSAALFVSAGAGLMPVGVPADPALAGLSVLLQAIAPAEGLASSVRTHWLQ